MEVIFEESSNQIDSREDFFSGSVVLEKPEAPEVDDAGEEVVDTTVVCSPVDEIEFPIGNGVSVGPLVVVTFSCSLISSFFVYGGNTGISMLPILMSPCPSGCKSWSAFARFSFACCFVSSNSCIDKISGIIHESNGRYSLNTEYLVHPQSIH